MLDDEEKILSYLADNWESMSEDTRQLIETIRDMNEQGHSDQEISSTLGIRESGVRNVLTLLGKRQYDPKAPFPEHSPEIQSFLENFGRWPQGEQP